MNQYQADRNDSGPTTPDPRSVWLLSAYHTGSHRSWARGYQEHSQWRVTLVTMAGRFWKWRMQGAAVELAAQTRRLLAEGPPPQAVIATDMVHLAAWLGLVQRELPVRTARVLYMHENQLTYPWRPGEKRDLTYGMINWLSQLAADEIWFNSRSHLESWFDELPRFLKHYPDYGHTELVHEVRQRSRVVPVGIRCGSLRAAPAGVPQKGLSGDESSSRDRPPLILWNQRWEYDKRPDRFFALLYRLQAANVPFRLAVAGENFRNIPEEFDKARVRLAGHIVHWGYLKSRKDYIALLRSSDLVVSTADHEFFGISILEAICAGAFPLLPNRLSYPEVVPDALHPACLYTDEEDLYQKARLRLRHPRQSPPSLRSHVAATYGWPVLAQRYDELLAALLARQSQ